MDPTVIHNNHGVFSRIWLHMLEKSLNKLCECISTKGAFDNLAMNDAVTEWDSRKNRKAFRNKQCICTHFWKTYRLPRTKKALRWAWVPRMDQARPRYDVRRSTELSSTKMSCSASYRPILVLYSRRFSTDRSIASRDNCKCEYWFIWCILCICLLSSL